MFQVNVQFVDCVCLAVSAEQVMYSGFIKPVFAKKTSAWLHLETRLMKVEVWARKTISESLHITHSHLIHCLYKQTVECSCKEFTQLAQEQTDLQDYLQFLETQEVH